LVGHDHRAKRIDKHQGRVVRLHVLGDLAQHHPQVACDGLVRQIDEANGVVHLVAVEERKLLLIAQHLQRWLAQDGEIQGRPFERGQREHHLVREGGFAAAGRARQ
jgi:hypothetical protein